MKFNMLLSQVLSHVTLNEVRSHADGRNSHKYLGRLRGAQLQAPSPMTLRELRGALAPMPALKKLILCGTIVEPDSERLRPPGCLIRPCNFSS